MKKKNGIEEMINQERLRKNIEHPPNQALELNNAKPDTFTTISKDAKQQPATSTKTAIYSAIQANKTEKSMSH